MKKLSTLFLSLVALASIVSCDSKDDETATEVSIEGKWELYQEGASLTTLETVTDDHSCGKPTVQFSNLGIYTTTESKYLVSCSTTTESGTWYKADKILITTDSDSKATGHEIIELNQFLLKLKTTDDKGTWYEVYIKK